MTSRKGSNSISGTISNSCGNRWMTIITIIFIGMNFLLSEITTYSFISRSFLPYTYSIGLTSVPRKYFSKFYDTNKDSSIGKREEAISAMTIDEIKSELDLRGVTYEDCVSKSQLVQKLLNSRVKGVADPTIIDQFNININSKENIMPNFNDQEIISQVTSTDGKLPGGLSPQIVQAMTSDPEIMRLLRDPKMQDVMKAVMTSGPDGIKKYLSDPDAMMLIKRLSQAMERATNAT